MRTPALLRLLFLTLAATSCVSRAYAGDDIAVKRINTPRGEAIEVVGAFPVGTGPFPAVIVGSGQGYDMRQPLFKELTAELLKHGIAVYRFNWAYWLKTRQPGGQSADRRNEIEDYTTVLNLARNESRVDSKRIVLAGKSLGSIIAWRVFRNTPDAKAVLLLTPVCNKPGPPPVTTEANYPEFTAETRQSAWILGNADPVCNPADIYRFGAQAKIPVRIAVIRGNHAFEEGKPGTADFAAKAISNIKLATSIAVDFVEAAVKP